MTAIAEGKEWMGIDIGGSHITVIVTDSLFNVLAKTTMSLQSRELEHVLSLFEKCALPLLTTHRICGVGIAVPGNVDPIAGVARYLPSFPWDRDIALSDMVRQRLRLPNHVSLSIRNDGRCAATAECHCGSGRNSSVFACLTLGTGIGGALMIQGKLFDGASFDAGDFGHHCIRSGKEDAFPCVCGKRGCFETQAAATGLIRHFQAVCQRKSGESFVNNTIESAHNAEAVLQAMRSGDENAKEAFAAYMDDLSTGIANLITFYNPDTIAIGGGLSQASEVLANITELVDAKTLPATQGRVKIVPCAVGVDAGAVGAAVLASLQQQQQQQH